MRLGVLVLFLLLAVAVAGCGVGPATDEEEVSKAVSTYLRALASGDTAKACAQLTRRVRGDGCDQAMKERMSRLDPETLDDAADSSIEIDVDDNRATAGLSEPEGARFLLVRRDDEWRIDSGYTLD
jgi:hypothetical protein